MLEPMDESGPAIFTRRCRRGMRGKKLREELIALPLSGILLLYHDSWLPPIAQAAGARRQFLRAFTGSYCLELALTA